MGLLDDAIREHLELKRRHGADPEEVSRQEREALGAPVRGEFAKPAAGGDADEPVEDALAPELGEDTEIAEPADPPGQEAPEEPAAVAAPEAGTEEDPWLVEDLADPDRDADPEAGPEPDAPGDRPAAVAARAAGAQPPQPDEKAEPGEDVLEETPEFLQETPEHERLWFEQKPPRDFDWDK